MEAMVILQKCSIKNHLTGIRVEKRDGDWYRTWAFKIDEKKAKNEGFDKNSIKGSFHADPKYPGCPYCEAISFYQCFCGKLNCYAGHEKSITCRWCGKTGICVEQTNFNIKSGGF